MFIFSIAYYYIEFKSIVAFVFINKYLKDLFFSNKYLELFVILKDFLLDYLKLYWRLCNKYD